jgi:CelD/BcsL family acetyltransferase involved in cellulose biosynthesis
MQVASPISDFQALICEPDFTCDPLELLRECGLVTYNFHNSLMSQTMLAPYYQSRHPSPQMDLSQGYEAYVAEQRAGGSDLFKSCANLARRMDREVGPLRFVAHSADPALLRHALDLKRAQYLRTGVPDIFADDWIRAVIEGIHTTQTDGFAGMLSLLYAGDRLVATHFGMRSRTIWHYWFPAYDIEMAKYSPGLNLILRMAAHAPSLGLRTIDLDKGRSLYKRRLSGGKGIAVGTGTVDRRYSRRIAQHALNLRMTMAKSPIAEPARLLLRWARGA